MDVPATLTSHKRLGSAEVLPPRVLIVDESEDSREALRAILSRRGVQILEAREGTAGLAIAREERPHVIVLDVDETAGDSAVCDEIAEQAKLDRSSLVLIGTTARPKGAALREIVSKPYHYAPLIRKIEELLAESGASSSRQVSKAA